MNITTPPELPKYPSPSGRLDLKPRPASNKKVVPKIKLTKPIKVIASIVIVFILAFVAYSFLTPDTKTTKTETTKSSTVTASSALSILQSKAPTLTGGVECDYFGQPVALLADETYCEPLLVAIQTVQIEGVSNDNITVEPTVCSLRSITYGVVREAYLCDTLLTAISGSPVRDGASAVAPVVSEDVATTEAPTSLTLDTRPITDGGVACVYYDADNIEYTTYNVDNADDCVPADELLTQ